MALNSYERKFLSDIIAIPSVGGDPEPGCPYGKESRRVLQFFLDEAASNGFRTGVIDDKVGYVEFGTGDRMIGIVCHLDVVPAGQGWKTDPFKLEEIDGKYYGRGIVDDKGPACTAYFAMKRLLDAGKVPNNRIRLILGSDEERTCDCVETYAAKGEIPDFAITPDAEFPVIFAEKGILQIKIKGKGNDKITANGGGAPNMVPASFELSYEGNTFRTEGVSAHASRPYLGTNAILKSFDSYDDQLIAASPILSFIKDNILGKDYAEYTGCSINDESGTVTANPAIVNIDADSESLVIDIRYPVTSDSNAIIDHITGKASAYGLEVEVFTNMAPLYKSTDSEEIKALTFIWNKYIDQYQEFKPEYREMYSEPLAIGGGTYARHMPNTIAFGMQAPWVEDQCHQANECMYVSDFELNIKILTEAMEALCQ